MGKNIIVYHRKLGSGIVIGSKDDKYIINFSNKIKYVPIDEVGKSLFIKGECHSLDKLEEFEEIDYSILVDMFRDYDDLTEIVEDIENEELYNIFKDNDKSDEILNIDNSIVINANENNMYIDDYEVSLNGTEIYTINKDEKTNTIEDNNNKAPIGYVKRIEVLDGSEYRNILIVDISTVSINNKVFLRIIGLDICTSTIVSIVDTNGKQFGLHSKKDEFMKIRNNTVIKAKFKYEQLERFTNVLRILSEFSIIGQSDLNKLRIKYNDLNYCNFITSFEKISEMLEEYSNKEFFCITHFTGSEVRKGKDKNNYQLKAGKFAANIHNKMNVSICDGLMFRGYALMSCIKNTNHKSPFILVSKLWGSYLTDQDYNLLKSSLKKKKADDYDNFYDQNNYEIIEDPPFELMSYNRQRLWEERDCSNDDGYNYSMEAGYNSDFVEDGCDDSYYEEWEEEDPEYENYKEPERLFIEPGSEWDEDYWEDDEDEYFVNMEEYKPTDEEVKEQEEFHKNYKYFRLLGFSTNSKIYKIEEITDDAFAIDFEKVKTPKVNIIDDDIELPF